MTSCFTAALATNSATSFFHSGPHISAGYELTILLGLASAFCKNSQHSCVVSNPGQLLTLSFACSCGCLSTQPNLTCPPTQYRTQNCSKVWVFMFHLLEALESDLIFVWLRKCIINICCIFICVPV